MDSWAQQSIRSGEGEERRDTHLYDLPETVLDVPRERRRHLVGQVRNAHRLGYVLQQSEKESVSWSARDEEGWDGTDGDAVLLPHARRTR